MMLSSSSATVSRALRSALRRQETITQLARPMTVLSKQSAEEYKQQVRLSMPLLSFMFTCMFLEGRHTVPSRIALSLALALALAHPCTYLHTLTHIHSISLSLSLSLSAHYIR